MFNESIFDVTKEIVVAHLNNSVPKAPSKETGQSIGEMITAIYESIETLVESKDQE